jgi:SOS response regulatory protein OraA/RecX
MEDDDIDFVLICAKRIEKMGGREIFADRDEKRKAIAALTRYGFSYDDIKDALKMKR